jgi:hypothetical protein
VTRIWEQNLVVSVKLSCPDSVDIQKRSILKSLRQPQGLQKLPADISVSEEHTFSTLRVTKLRHFSVYLVYIFITWMRNLVCSSETAV